MYDDILIATDGREGMAEVIDEALDVAELCDATVHGLYVVGNQREQGTAGAKWLTLGDETNTAGERAVADIAERAEAAGIASETAIGQGAPDERVLEYVAEQGIDLIVIGTRGRTGLDRLLGGSVTEDIIREIDVPVLVLRYGADPSAVGPDTGSTADS